MVALGHHTGLTGPALLGALDDALRDIRREEDEITRRIARTTDRIGKLRETEAAQVRALAEHMLAGDEREGIEARLAGAETRAREMLGAHARAMDALEAELGTHETALARLSAERLEALEAIGRHHGELDALAPAIARALADSPAYAQAQAAQAQLQAMAQKAAQKAQEAHASRAEQVRPYRQDPLFSYLWSRQFGTEGYGGKGLVRSLDAMVARHIGYDQARPNYVMLEAIAERLDEHARKLAAQAEAARLRRAEIETAAIDAAGGSGARAALLEREAEIVRIDGEIVLAEDAREALTERHKHLAEGGDPTFEDALTVLGEALDAPEIAGMMDTATRAEDEAAISRLARIADTRRRIEEDEAELGEQRTRLGTLEARRRELEDIDFEFRRARFDDPGSRFATPRLAETLLSDFLKGALDARQYWQTIADAQDWDASVHARPGWTEPPAARRTVTETGFSRPR